MSLMVNSEAKSLTVHRGAVSLNGTQEGSCLLPLHSAAGLHSTGSIYTNYPASPSRSTSAQVAPGVQAGPHHTTSYSSAGPTSAPASPTKIDGKEFFRQARYSCCALVFASRCRVGCCCSGCSLHCHSFHPVLLESHMVEAVARIWKCSVLQSTPVCLPGDASPVQQQSGACTHANWHVTAR